MVGREPSAQTNKTKRKMQNEGLVVVLVAAGGISVVLVAVTAQDKRARGGHEIVVRLFVRGQMLVNGRGEAALST